jgi:hypothetical protein
MRSNCRDCTGKGAKTGTGKWLPIPWKAPSKPHPIRPDRPLSEAWPREPWRVSGRNPPTPMITMTECHTEIL